jgi:hypothetical protein
LKKGIPTRKNMGVSVMVVTEMERSDLDACRNTVNSFGTEKPKSESFIALQ